MTVTSELNVFVAPEVAPELCSPILLTLSVFYCCPLPYIKHAPHSTWANLDPSLGYPFLSHSMLREGIDLLDS